MKSFILKFRFFLISIIISLVFANNSLFPEPQKINNSHLANEILSKINKNKKITIEHLSVTETQPGYITLEGIADLYGEKYYSQKIAEESKSIKIDNKIIVKPNLMRNDSDIENELFNKIKNELTNAYFDDVSFKVNNGIVNLYGKIRKIGLINKIVEIAIWTPGVRHVENHLVMLPPSKQDDDIRIALLTKMSNDLRLAHYFTGSFPKIIILVENGNVSLKGYVNSNADRIIMGQIANSIIGVMSVTNLLQIDK